MSTNALLTGNNGSCRVFGIGIVINENADGVVNKLGKVKHVLELKQNMISMSILNSKGHKFIHEGGVLKISKVTYCYERK